MNTDTHFSSNSNEWYTPPEIIESVIKVMGHIDLDPCSPATPKIIGALLSMKQRNPVLFDEIVKLVSEVCREYPITVPIIEGLGYIATRLDINDKWLRNRMVSIGGERLHIAALWARANSGCSIGGTVPSIFAMGMVSEINKDLPESKRVELSNVPLRADGDVKGRNQHGRMKQ